MAKFAQDPTAEEASNLLRKFGAYADRIVISFVPAGAVGKNSFPVGCI